MSANMSNLSILFMLLYFVFTIGIGVFLLVLLTMFVKAHRRGAIALEVIASKLPGLVRDEPAIKL